MATGSESSVLSLLQPDLLTRQELADMLKSRCCRLDNLESMSKENLVSLFRRVVLPLPQRSYRCNRRGKMLTARRLKSGLEGGEGGGGEQGGQGASRGSERSFPAQGKVPGDGGSRLKPPPTTSGKIRLTTSSEYSSGLDNVVINDRKKPNHRDNPTNHSSSPQKRPHEVTRTSSERSPDSGGKKQRVAIKWP